MLWAAGVAEAAAGRYNRGMHRPSLSVSLAGLAEGSRPWAGGGRGALEWAARAGFRAVQLDGAMEGVRARELDRSGRRDLAGAMRRLGLSCSGIDLWIPPAHFTDPARAERAVEAVLGTTALAADLARMIGNESRPVVALTLPPTGQVGEPIARDAEIHGVRIADHAELKGVLERALAAPSIGVGIDPAVFLVRGSDAAGAVIQAGRLLVQCRLSDADQVGRVEVGRGRFDVPSYEAALAGVGYSGFVVADLRGLSDPRGAAAAAQAAWGAG